MVEAARERTVVSKFGGRLLRAQGTLLAVAALVTPIGCGESSSDDDGAPGGKGGSSGSMSGASSGGKAGGSAGKGGAAGSGGSAGRAGSSGSGGSSGGAVGGTENNGGKGGSSGGTTAGKGGQTAGGAGGSSGSGGSETAGDAGAGGSVDLPDGLEALVVAFCETARTCCEAADEPSDLAGCETGFLGQVDNFSLVIRGTVTVDATALEGCVAAYEDAADGCTLTGVQAACHGIFRGTLADGEPCTDAAECDREEGPKVCEIIQSSDPPDVGTCVDPPRGVDGTPCGSTCKEGTYCSITSVGEAGTPVAICYEEDSLYCIFGEGCAEIVANGDDCTAPEACGSDGYCDGSMCVPRAGLDDDCFFTPDCESGLSCVSGTCVAEPFANSSTCMGHPPSLD